jgi:hypothetical protein
MRASFCAIALALTLFLPGELCAQMFRSEHLNISNTNPPPPPFRDSLYVVGFGTDPIQRLNLTPRGLYWFQVTTLRMESGLRDAVDRVYNKNEEMRDYYLATTQPSIPDDRVRVPGPFTEHELRYYGPYIVTPPKSALEAWESEQRQNELRTPGQQQNELRTPGTRFRPQFQR